MKASPFFLETNESLLAKLIYNALKKYDPRSDSYSALFNYVANNSYWSTYIFGSYRIDFMLKKREFIKKRFKELFTEGDDQPSDNSENIPIRYFLSEEDIARYLKNFETSLPHVTKEFVLTKNVKILGELLELSETEMLFMQVVHGVMELFDCYENTLFHVFSMKKSVIDVWTMLLDIDKKEVKTIFDTSMLLKYNFIAPSKHEGEGVAFRKMFTLIYSLSEILNIATLKKKDVETILFPGLISTELSVKDYHQQDDINIISNIVSSTIKNKTVGTNIMLYGLPGTGKTELAMALAKKNGWKLKSVGDIDLKDTKEKGRADRIFNLKLASKIYAKSKEKVVLLFDEMEDLFKYDINAEFSKAYLNRILETTPVPIIWTCNHLHIMEPSILRRMTMSIKFDIPPSAARKKIWEYENKRQELGLDDETMSTLSEIYDVVPSVIKTVTAIAKASNLDKTKLGSLIENQSMLMNYGFKKKFNSDQSFSQQQPLYDLSFVNSDLDMISLTERLKGSKPNFSLCLYGPPGTGKSAYGKYLASVLGKQVLFKKASDLLGKYVGETEANIAAAFEQAKTDDKLLIFDEADSFLGSREAAQRSWEVSSVNEFLTQMESHDKPFVCTTNLVKGMDTASLRRFTFKIKLDFLKRHQVEAIYKKYFNHEAPKFILDCGLLTPGDFAVLKKKIDILNISDNIEIAKLLQQEIEMKPDFRHKLGF